MYSTPTMDAGRLGYLMKTADPLSPLTVLVTPAGVTDIPVPRPRLMVPIETPVFPASACMIAGGSVETAGVQSPPLGAIGTEARLLTKLPICTTTGTEHLVTPRGVGK